MLGVSALIAASPKAFFVMQCLGATYLLYLAYKSFQVRSGVILSEAQSAESKDLGAKKLYLRGIIMNITNPKAVLFALSFIPPAVKMDSPLNPTVQMAILGAEFILATFIVFGSVALLAGAVKKFMLKSPKANRNLNWFSGVVFVLLAVALFAL